MAGVSVRTLHHYDAIGLLVPRIRTDAGYRLYTDADLLRLQQILIGRELGLSLEEIGRSLDDPGFDRRITLIDQRERLRERVQQTEAMIRAIDVALAALDDGQGERVMNWADLFEGFDPPLTTMTRCGAGGARQTCTPKQQNGPRATRLMTGGRSSPNRRPSTMTRTAR